MKTPNTGAYKKVSGNETKKITLSEIQSPFTESLAGPLGTMVTGIASSPWKQREKTHRVRGQSSRRHSKRSLNGHTLSTGERDIETEDTASC
jgi:hypothetical protein